MSDVKAETFENILVIDEEYCEKYNYPLTRFAIEYPNNIEVTLHEDEYSYIFFQVKKDNVITEELSIGSTTLTIPLKSNSLESLEGLAAQFESQNESLKFDLIGKSNFKGKMEYQLNGIADYSSYKEYGYDGTYRMIILIPFPEKNNKIKAVLVTFLANEKSGIKSYSDFQEKGIISKIWNTFRYLE